MEIFARSHSGQINTIKISDQNGGEGGSEGRVFFSGDGDLCAKIFHSTARDRKKIDKLKLMLDPKFDPLRNFSANDSTICWPVYTAHETRNGDPVGYIMPAISSSVPLDALFAATNEMAKSAKFEDRIFIAGLLSLLVSQVHSHGAIVGDLNPANVRLKKASKDYRWSLHLIDADSFQLKDGTRTLTSDIGRDLYSSPRLLELQKNSKSANHGWTGLRRTRADDEYALAVIVFQLLLLTHPMKAKGNNISQNIVNKTFAYTVARDKLSKYAPIAKFEALPTPLQKMFSDTFLAHTTYRARAWAMALQDLEMKLDTTAVKAAFEQPASPWQPSATPKVHQAPINRSPGGVTKPAVPPRSSPSPKLQAQKITPKKPLIQTIVVEPAVRIAKSIFKAGMIALGVFIALLIIRSLVGG